MDLPDPLSIPACSLSVNIMTGLLYASFSLLAIIPTTLSCTSGMYATITRSARVAVSPIFPAIVASSSILVMSFTPFSVMDFLSLLIWISSAAFVSAFAAFFSSRNSRLVLASPRRPAALIHGPIRNPRSYVVIFFSFFPLSRMRALSPGFRLSFRLSRAYLTNILFSSTRSIISQFVASPRTSKNSCISRSSMPQSLYRYCMNLQATPAPHSPLNGYWQSTLWLSMTASAGGRVYVFVPSPFS